MRSTLLLLTLSFTLAISCKKKDKPGPGPEPEPEPPVSEETVRTRLMLKGDILLSEAPLPNGRRVEDPQVNARELRDSTLYCIMVMKLAPPNQYGNRLYKMISTGMFNNPDLIEVNLPVEGDIKITAIAYKRGTGPGLAYTWENGEQVFGYPINTTLRNRMDTVSAGTPRVMEDTLTFLTLFDPADTVKSVTGFVTPEVDGYRGTSSFTATGLPGIVTLNMKRMAFGIKFSAANFNSGTLIAELPGNPWQGSSSKALTPENIDEKYFIYTSDDFKHGDSAYMNVKLSWKTLEGDMVPLGEKVIAFKRNILTTLHVTISSSGRTVLDPIITETEWSGTETVDF